ncbi:large ribosomal subunit protein uL30m isoform X2 [Mustela lutreola]|uniref:large ribosomal subunit protein uL30m isoform X2 n=1 Tax=Mustela lutreola TaxID=9666 RepID=UPI002796E6A0|nr:large ribosomal subunit protein uL30m isoform X2 [Mustela lutreola]
MSGGKFCLFSWSSYVGTLGRCRLVFLLDSEFAGRRSLTGPGPMYCPTASRKASGRPDAVSQFASPSVCGARGPGRLGAGASEEGGSASEENRHHTHGGDFVLNSSEAPRQTPRQRRHEESEYCPSREEFPDMKHWQ